MCVEKGLLLKVFHQDENLISWIISLIIQLRLIYTVRKRTQKRFLSLIFVAVQYKHLNWIIFKTIWKKCRFCPSVNEPLLPPANVVCEGYIFTGVCDSVNRGGMRGFIQGGMRVFVWGVCMVLLGGHSWFYSGGVRGFIQGGMCGFIWGGMHGFIWGACVVLFGGGMRGFSSFFGYNEIRSMSGRYASYWNAFLFVWILFQTTTSRTMQTYWRPPAQVPSSFQSGESAEGRQGFDCDGGCDTWNLCWTSWRCAPNQRGKKRYIPPVLISHSRSLNTSWQCLCL